LRVYEASALETTETTGVNGKKMDKFNCILISGNAFTDRFMRDADLFETFKAFAAPHCVEITLKPGVTREQGLQDLRSLCERNGERVVAVFIPGEAKGAYCDTKVKLISNGKHFQPLDDILNHYEFKCEESPIEA